VLDDEALESFMLGFFGYGNPRADLWFIGMEEAGATQEEEMKDRLDAWHALGRNAIVNCADFCALIRTAADSSMNYLFKSPAPIQSTWGPLIRLLLRSKEEITLTTEHVRRAQEASWLRSNSANCLIQLMPLPSPNIDDWLYSEWSRIEYLRRGRETYCDSILPRRVNIIRGMLAEHQPRAVVFCGTGYLTHWSTIAGGDFRKADQIAMCKNAKGQAVRARVMQKGGTIYVSVHHPSYTKQSAYFEGVGDLLRSRLTSR
jgi:hypothetical protein